MPARTSASACAGSASAREVGIAGLELAQARQDLLGQHARARRSGQQLAVVVRHFPKPVERPRMKKRWPTM